MIEFIIGLFVFVFLFQSILGPILVRFTQWAKKYPAISAIESGMVPQSILEKIQAHSNGLEAIGFKTIGFFSISDFIPNVQGTFVLSLNSKDKTWAMVPVLECKGMEACYVEFCTEFSDDTEICTNNSDQLQAFIKTPDKKVFQFPKVVTVEMLYKVHDYLKYKHYKNRTVVLNGVGSEVRYLQSSLTKDFIKQSELGYYYFDSNDEKFRPTWKGSILMTWKLMFPMSLIQKMFIYLKSKGIMEEVRLLIRDH